MVQDPSHSPTARATNASNRILLLRKGYGVRGKEPLYACSKESVQETANTSLSTKTTMSKHMKDKKVSRNR
ncbi:hypothetical protein QYF61_012589 [Mycteria americana]|uniref:Uncharacterized protein n=1 Tax=Mycteria americana TaxID=33587 RepID=A0AAN7RT54_MYCAM|nr:hypothetical protein QYF61_012580 [Mycteria americana]KAK4806868.1 hypothetical protein QYF61_012589 [Mycteria americana]